MDIAGHKINNWVIIAGGGGVVLLYVLYRNASKSAAATQSASTSTIDPLTGLPTSQDNQIDPSTGMTYLQEAQEYGSVSAAEAAVSSGSAYAAGTGGYYGAEDAGYPTSTSNVGTSVAIQSYATNAAWSQAVTAGLAGLGYNSEDIASALGLFFAQHPLGTASDGVSYASIIQAAEAEYGPPPQGTYSIIPEPTTSGATGTTTGGTTTSGTFALPSGRSDTPYSTYVDLGWTAVKGAQFYHYQVLTASGSSVSDQMTTATSARVSGLKPSTSYSWRMAVDTTSAMNASPWSSPSPFTTKS